MSVKFSYRFEPPWLGPMLLHDAKEIWLGLGADPRLGEPVALCMLPAKLTDTGWAWDDDVLRNLALLRNPANVVLHDQTIWPLPCTDPHVALPAAFPSTLAGTETDWHAEHLPNWAASAQRLAVFHVYAQGTSMAPPGSGGGSAWSMLAEHRIVQNLGHGFLPSWFKDKVMSRPIARPLLPMPGDPEKYLALRQGIEEALLQLNDCGDDDRPVPRTPRALIAKVRTAAPTDPPGICLALGSCQYPPGILNQMPGFASWQRLQQRLLSGDEPRPSFLVLTGDQVYIDASAGLFDPAQRDDRYVKPYEAWLRDRHVSEVVRQVPVMTMLDDHEIEDNWEPMSEHLSQARWTNEQRRREGLESFWRYQRPPPQPVPGTRRFFRPWRAYRSKQIGLPVFLLDTRTGRELRSSALSATATMISSRQWLHLRAWLLNEPELPKLVVCPSLVLPRHRNAAPARLLKESDHGHAAALRSDGWDGYPESFYALLQFIADHSIRRVVFLSGDEHLGIVSVAKVRPLQSSKPEDEVAVYIVHSPGLNTPYRFANSLADDFIVKEEFDFGSKDAPSHHCSVEATAFLEGAGFVIVNVGQDAHGTWKLSCDFDVVNVPKNDWHTFTIPLV